jgi:hypothetical protein
MASHAKDVYRSAPEPRKRRRLLREGGRSICTLHITRRAQNLSAERVNPPFFAGC